MVADLFLALYTHGPQTVSELSRNSGIERTRVYRLLDKLRELNLLEIEVRYKRHIYTAAPIGNLRVHIEQQQRQLKGILSELDAIEELLPPNSLTSSTTRVQFYQGNEGVKQMLWHQNRAKTSMLAILCKNLQLSTDEQFYERWVTRQNELGTQFRGIISDEFIASQKAWYGDQQTTRLKNWQPRYISKNLLPITHNQVIYNDVVAFFNWKDGDVFGIEIYNKQIAEMHRYFFKAYWHMATPINDVTGS